MTEQFKYLFSPMKIGPMTVRNRIVSTAHGTGYSQHGLPTEQYARRAGHKGGVGLIEIELTREGYHGY